MVCHMKRVHLFVIHNLSSHDKISVQWIVMGYGTPACHGKSFYGLSWKKDQIACHGKRVKWLFMDKESNGLSWKKDLMICHGKKVKLLVTLIGLRTDKCLYAQCAFVPEYEVNIQLGSQDVNG